MKLVINNQSRWNQTKSLSYWGHKAHSFNLELSSDRGPHSSGKLSNLSFRLGRNKVESPIKKKNELDIRTKPNIFDEIFKIDSNFPKCFLNTKMLPEIPKLPQRHKKNDICENNWVSRTLQNEQWNIKIKNSELLTKQKVTQCPQPKKSKLWRNQQRGLIHDQTNTYSQNPLNQRRRDKKRIRKQRQYRNVCQKVQSQETSQQMAKFKQADPNPEIADNWLDLVPGAPRNTTRYIIEQRKDTHTFGIRVNRSSCPHQPTSHCFLCDPEANYGSMQGNSLDLLGLTGKCIFGVV